MPSFTKNALKFIWLIGVNINTIQTTVQSIEFTTISLFKIFEMVFAKISGNPKQSPFITLEGIKDWDIQAELASTMARESTHYHTFLLLDFNIVDFPIA